MVEIKNSERILLKSNFQRKFFDKIFDIIGLSLKDLSKILEVNYWTLKGWRRGKYCIPGYAFKRLLNLCPSSLKKDVLNNIVEIKIDGWGRRKGALKNISRYSKKELKKRMKYIRNFKCKKLIKVKLDESFWELVGIMMGDGCLSKFFSNYENLIRYDTTISGNLYEDKVYYLTHVIPLLNRVFNINPKPKERLKDSVIIIHIRNKLVFKTLMKIGLPIGKKTKKLKLTEKMLELLWKNKSKIIRGLFDTDGFLFARKDEGYKYPYFGISSRNDLLRKQLKTTLREKGFPAYIHSNNVIVRGGKNLIKWMKEIGSSHPIHKERFNVWLKNGKLLPKYLGR